MPAGAPWGFLTAGVGVLAWVILQPRTPDLAAQVYRVRLFHEVGFGIWDERWYGGHNLPGYSLMFPALAALLGIRLVGALAVLASTLMLERLARTFYGRAAPWVASWFAVAAVADLWIGRVTFALGVSLALAAVLAYARGRVALALVMGALCAAGSPVASVLLALAGVSLALARRSSRDALILSGPGVLVALALAVLFPEGGFEPFPTLSFLLTAAVVLGFIAVLPRGRTVERMGAAVYLLAALASLVVHTPMGSNIERYGVLLAGPLLLGCVLNGRMRGGGGRLTSTPAVACVLVGAAIWTLWGPVRELEAVAHNASTSSAYYLPVERFMASHGGSAVRVEVPFTRSHWEAAWLAPTVSLARGWEKQLDERYDGVLLGRDLSAASYSAWLLREAVSYVALPDTPLDPSSAREGRLIRGGLPYLREVQQSPHWRIYRVLGATALVEGPGSLLSMGHDQFVLRARAAGSLLVRVRYTRYFKVSAGDGCVSSAPGGWTRVEVRSPGRVTVRVRFSLGRALGMHPGCGPAQPLGVSP